MRKAKTIIHVSQPAIRNNLKTGGRAPVLTVKNRKTNRYAMQAIIRDSDGNEVARVVYADGVNVKKLSCGARVWIESTLDVELIGEGEVYKPSVCEV